jgi:hypothetical protein
MVGKIECKSLFLDLISEKLHFALSVHYVGAPRAIKRAEGGRGALNAGQAWILWSKRFYGSGWPC